MTRPLAVPESQASEMIGLKPYQFRELVELGVLPPPVPLGKYLLWRTADLEAILNGDAAKPKDEDFEI